jgi:hypothetical protein
MKKLKEVAPKSKGAIFSREIMGKNTKISHIFRSKKLKKVKFLYIMVEVNVNDSNRMEIKILI